jgi:hypothetical protein
MIIQMKALGSKLARPQGSLSYMYIVKLKKSPYENLKKEVKLRYFA